MEDDVPGASLEGRKPEQLKNDELKRCWGAEGRVFLALACNYLKDRRER